MPETAAHSDRLTGRMRHFSHAPRREALKGIALLGLGVLFLALGIGLGTAYPVAFPRALLTGMAGLGFSAAGVCALRDSASLRREEGLRREARPGRVRAAVVVFASQDTEPLPSRPAPAYPALAMGIATACSGLVAAGMILGSVHGAVHGSTEAAILLGSWAFIPGFVTIGLIRRRLGAWGVATSLAAMGFLLGCMGLVELAVLRGSVSSGLSALIGALVAVPGVALWALLKAYRPLNAWLEDRGPRALAEARAARKAVTAGSAGTPGGRGTPSP